jgi:hypothetical protein
VDPKIFGALLVPCRSEAKSYNGNPARLAWQAESKPPENHPLTGRTGFSENK